MRHGGIIRDGERKGRRRPAAVPPFAREMENRPSVDINLRLDRRRRRNAIPQSVYRMMTEGYHRRSFAILSPVPKLRSIFPPCPVSPPPLPLLASPFSFPSRRITIMLILARRGSRRRSIGRIDEADEVKEERWKVILRPRVPPPLIPPDRTLILLSPVCGSIYFLILRQAYVAASMHAHRSGYVSWKESAQLHYAGSERVSSTQSRVLAGSRGDANSNVGD